MTNKRTTIPTYSRSDPPDPVEPYKPHTIEENRVSGELRALVLRVNIAGRDRNVELTVGALQDHGLSGPAAVEVLRSIQSTLEDLVRALERRPETTESHSTDDQS